MQWDNGENMGFFSKLKEGLTKTKENLIGKIDKMLAGFMECATHGVPTIAYLEAVLKGTGKKKTPVKVLQAQNFPQRDYSDVNDSMMDNLAKEIAAFNAGQAG